MTYCMVLTTCEDETCAKELAGKLMEEKLAACVQLSPITSYYTWQGELHADPEIRLLIKTRAGLYPKLEKFIQASHDYDVPQIVQIPIENGSKDYLDWIDENTINP